MNVYVKSEHSRARRGQFTLGTDVDSEIWADGVKPKVLPEWQVYPFHSLITEVIYNITLSLIKKIIHVGRRMSQPMTR